MQSFPRWQDFLAAHPWSTCGLEFKPTQHGVVGCSDSDSESIQTNKCGCFWVQNIVGIPRWMAFVPLAFGRSRAAVRTTHHRLLSTVSTALLGTLLASTSRPSSAFFGAKFPLQASRNRLAGMPFSICPLWSVTSPRCMKTWILQPNHTYLRRFKWRI